MSGTKIVISSRTSHHGAYRLAMTCAERRLWPQNVASPEVAVVLEDVFRQCGGLPKAIAVECSPELK